jgi:hypothetical protein
MKKFFFSVCLFVSLAGMNVAAAEEVNASVPPAAPAAGAAPAEKADPDIAQRVADLEAYVNNVARGADAADAKVKSNISAAGYL